MSAVTIQDVRAEVVRIGAMLTAYDFGGEAVQCLSQSADGAAFFFPDAFLLKYKDYYLVFTEHYGYHYFHEDDMLCWEFGRRRGKTRLASEFRASPVSKPYLRRHPKLHRQDRAEADIVTPETQSRRKP